MVLFVSTNLNYKSYIEMMNTIACNTHNPYRTQKGFLVDPFASLYKTSDKEIAQDESVENLINYAWSLEECISGDLDLQTVVTEIKDQILSFVYTGLLAYKVKIFKLYRRVHKNFKTFCEKALGTSHWQVNRKIEAARVVIELAQAGFSILPTCEAQARPLTKLHGAELCNKWRIVVNSLEPHMITSKQINEVLGVETKTASLRLPKKLYEQIKRKALEMGLSIEQLLNMLVEDDYKTDTVKEEALIRWEEDLKTFTNEKIEDIKENEKSVPTEQLSEGEMLNCPSSNLKQTSKKTLNEAKILKDTDLKHKNLTSSIPANKYNYSSQIKKSKNRKPLFEILELDKKNQSKKEVKYQINKNNKISENILNKVDQDKS